MTPLTYALWAGAYLVGSVPFGLLIARFLAPGGPIDIRRHGSGNIGATNVWRVLGPRLGLLCFALDFLKGLVPTLVGGLLLGAVNNPGASAELLLGWLGVATACILGHLFPVWLRFKGGKGVATSFGAMLGVFPVLTIAVLGSAVVWGLSARLTRMVGISSCLAAIALPLFVLAQRWAPASWRQAIAGEEAGAAAPVLWPYLLLSALLAALVISKHRGNIARTIAGTERRIGQRETVGTSAQGADSSRKPAA
ncbi:MAG TPA: glycerol-3-phosphate 1-O-acyltransferase PlsY [Phycisphaerales bacterium]|nr:glycerol-3-phosphate 1-O-acyltransferase PlsY [Phycisphaerales bacterium]